MLHELPDESENRALKMNKSKTKVIIENDYKTLRSRALKAISTWDRYTIPVTKTKTRIFREESRPDGQHSPSTTTSSRVTYEHA